MATKPFPILFIAPTDVGGAIASSGLLKRLVDEVPQGQFTIVADEERPDLCEPLGSCAHGFTLAIPRSLRDDTEHAVHGYAVDTEARAPAGAARPPAGGGLWRAHQLCALVKVRSSPAGTVVRVTMRHGTARSRQDRTPGSRA